MIKQITINADNVVTGASIGGFIPGGIDVEEIPEEVMNCPKKWTYVNGAFKPNPNYSDNSLQLAKENKIAESKERLAEWLATNPMQYTDGNYYSVTEEKQSLLNSNLASYERANAAGVPYPLKWNSTGAECAEWTYSDLLMLSLAIAAYVAPKVSMQQAIELEIKAAETMEQLDKVVITYD